MKIYPPTLEGFKEMINEIGEKTEHDYEADRDREDEPEDCFHVCTSNCRRVGCNCECGEWHEKKSQ